MASTYTPNKNIEKPAHNDYIDDWEIPVNSDWDILDACLGKVSVINMTGRASYTLTYTDLQAASLRFTGVLNSGGINVTMPTGISGEFAIVNQTTQTDSTSALQLNWASGGNTYGFPQNVTQRMAADAVQVSWYPTAQPVLIGAPPTLSIASNSTYLFNLTAPQYNSPFIYVTGNNTTGSIVDLFIPNGLVRSIGFICNASATAIQFRYASIGSPKTLTPGGGYQPAIADGSNCW